MESNGLKRPYCSFRSIVSLITLPIMYPDKYRSFIFHCMTKIKGTQLHESSKMPISCLTDK
jgi:hypothetical protein